MARRWTSVEDELLREAMRTRKERVEDLARALGRTEGALRKRWQRGFLSPDRATLAKRLAQARALGIGLHLSAEDVAELR